MPGKKKKYNARFPPARIKKIMQSDEEVGKVAAAVPVIISRALELFVENMLQKANEVTSRRGARTLTPSHLKMCIDSETRFDFLKDLVSGVPDLQGDMDINPDNVTSATRVGEQLSPQIQTPSNLTTSSYMTRPNNCSMGSSTNCLSSDVSCNPITSSSISSPSELSAINLCSAQNPNLITKNMKNKKKISKSGSSDDYQSRQAQQNAQDSALEQKDNLNTKVGKKRGRPRKSPSDPKSCNKPKKTKTSSGEVLEHPAESMRNTHTLQHSSSYSKPSSDDVFLEPDEEAAIDPENETKSHARAKHKMCNSFPQNPAAVMLRQISKTYSSESTPTPDSNSCSLSPRTPATPSFTLTFPIPPTNSENIISLTKPKLQKTKDSAKTSSSQLENQERRVESNSKCVPSNCHSLPAKSTLDQITSNNGFPFTISNILENDHQRHTKTILEDDTSANDEKIKQVGHSSLQSQMTSYYNSASQPTPSDSVMKKIGFDGASVSNHSKKMTGPIVSWTMNVVPSISTSDEIDEDYDA